MADDSHSLRVLVNGASIVTWTSLNAQGRHDRHWGRVLEDELGRTHPRALVRVEGRLGQPTPWIIDSWEEHVLQWAPDVIVMMPGTYEVLHVFLPHWLERLANQPNRRPGRLRDFFYRRIVRVTWKTFGNLQSRLDAWTGTRLMRRRLDSVALVVRRYVETTRLISDCPIFVIGLLPAVEPVSKWHPGQPERVGIVNAQLRELIPSLDGVEFIDLAPLAARMADADPMGATPDGVHFSEPLHREIALTMATAIENALRPAAPQPQRD